MYTRAVLKIEKPESDQADASFQYLTAWYTCQYSVADIPQRVKGKYEMLKCYAKTADNFDWHVWEKKKCNTWGIFCAIINSQSFSVNHHSSFAVWDDLRMTSKWDIFSRKLLNNSVSLQERDIGRHTNSKTRQEKVPTSPLG